MPEAEELLRQKDPGCRLQRGPVCLAAKKDEAEGTQPQVADEMAGAVSGGDQAVRRYRPPPDDTKDETAGDTCRPAEGVHRGATAGVGIPSHAC